MGARPPCSNLPSMTTFCRASGPTRSPDTDQTTSRSVRMRPSPYVRSIRPPLLTIRCRNACRSRCGPGAHFIPLRNPAFARACSEICQPGIWRPSYRCVTRALAARWMSARLTARREKRAVRASGQGKAAQSAFGHDTQDSRPSGPGSAVPSKSRGNSGVESTRPADSGEAPVNGLASEGNSNSYKPVGTASDTGRILSGPALDPLDEGTGKTAIEARGSVHPERRLHGGLESRFRVEPGRTHWTGSDTTIKIWIESGTDSAGGGKGDRIRGYSPNQIRCSPEGHQFSIWTLTASRTS